MAFLLRHVLKIRYWILGGAIGTGATVGNVTTYYFAIFTFIFILFFVFNLGFLMLVVRPVERVVARTATMGQIRTVVDQHECAERTTSGRFGRLARTDRPTAH